MSLYEINIYLVYGLKQPFKFLEKTLTRYCQQFKLENLAVIIGQTSFENLIPKNVKLKFQAQRQVCCCTQHINIDYVRTKLNELLCINGQLVISDNETLVSRTSRKSDNINCIEKLCKNCSVNMLKEIGKYQLLLQ